MRVFLAGASGVIGIRVLPLLASGGHVVAAMTRSPQKADQLQALGGEPVVCDVYDLEALTAAVVAFAPEAVMHQLTDLPDALDELSERAAKNDRMRSEGTRNLIAAAQDAGAHHFVAQSIAWRPARGDEVVKQHERQVLAIHGIVARYGRLYGPGTYYENELPAHPRIQIDAAAHATPPLLHASPGITTLAEPE
jgi:nucleoside-diphosphate-sugar epimerase